MAPRFRHLGIHAQELVGRRVVVAVDCAVVVTGIGPPGLDAYGCAGTPLATLATDVVEEGRRHSSIMSRRDTPDGGWSSRPAG